LEKKKAERRKKNFGPCVIQMFGVEGCAVYAQRIGRSLGSDLYDIATGPTCTAMVSETLEMKYSQQDLASAGAIATLDKIAEAGLKSDNLLYNVGGGLSLLLSLNERANSFERCLNQ
jgi:hypothetical protein